MMNTYYPKHSENHMKHEGDVKAARDCFLTGKNRMLYHLVKQRFSWMNHYIKPSDETIIELGCGAGLSKQFIKNKNFTMTDVADYEWVNKYVDAMNIDYPNESIDVVVCSHMIHHIFNPASFFDSLEKNSKREGES